MREKMSDDADVMIAILEGQDMLIEAELSETLGEWGLETKIQKAEKHLVEAKTSLSHGDRSGAARHANKGIKIVAFELKRGEDEGYWTGVTAVVSALFGSLAAGIPGGVGAVGYGAAGTFAGAMVGAPLGPITSMITANIGSVAGAAYGASERSQAAQMHKNELLSLAKRLAEVKEKAMR